MKRRVIKRHLEKREGIINSRMFGRKVNRVSTEKGRTILTLSQPRMS